MRRRLLAVAAVLALAACGPAGAPPAERAIPADATAAAVIDLARLRAAPAYAALPAALRTLAGPLAAAKELALAWNGKDLLLIATGDFAQPPAGYTTIGKGVAAAGVAERIEAARTALAVGSKLPGGSGVPSSTAEIRAVFRGDGALPLAGNLANLSKLMRKAEVTTLTAHLEQILEVEIASQCDSASGAQDLEESLRAAVTLAASAARDPALAAMLKSARIARESRAVRTYVVGAPDVFAKLD
jgi:predicted small lipoprotein YifL